MQNFNQRNYTDFNGNFIAPTKPHGPSKLPVLDLYQRAHIGLASPFHRKGSLKHSLCTVHRYVSRGRPYAAFPAQRRQKI